MNELLIAVKAYVAACNVERPVKVSEISSLSGTFYIADSSAYRKTPAEKAREAANEAYEKAERLEACEAATNKLIDTYKASK